MSFLSLLLAAALPLGVWPEDGGPPQTVIDEVEIYSVEPEDDFWILAVQPLVPPLAAVDAESVSRLAAMAGSLGADAVLLLAELPVSEIPDDPEEPLSTTGRFAAAVFLVLDLAVEAPAPELERASHRGPQEPSGDSGRHRLARQ
jgi:hypothetical protein